MAAGGIPIGGGVNLPPRLKWWKNTVNITQFVWNHGEIERDLGWVILVLIPNSNTYTRGVGLLES